MTSADGSPPVPTPRAEDFLGNLQDRPVSTTLSGNKSCTGDNTMDNDREEAIRGLAHTKWESEKAALRENTSGIGRKPSA
jgi:hypothetical protein